MNDIMTEDLASIYSGLSQEEKDRFGDATVVITGFAGFLGYYLMHFLSLYAHELRIKRIVGLDNFMLRRHGWVDRLAGEKGKVEVHHFDIIKDRIASIAGASDADLVIHMASIASPTYYRKYPLETLDANVQGLRNLLDHYRDRDLRGFLFFSSSEIYGDPPADRIPTDEEYRGNVAAIGPRACYDEAKRFGETLCYLFAREYGKPITIARPFNNFGPGMDLGDKRVPADFAKAIIENRDIEMYSDGTPTRTFCYISDAVTGYLKVLTHGTFDYFNIGTDAPEISIRELADIYVREGRERFRYTGSARFAPPPEKEYLTHNPNRRCPNIEKAKSLLQYRPTIHVEAGVRRFLTFLRDGKGAL